VSKFDTAVAFLLAQEGGYSADPDDHGGETNWGISKRAYPNLDILTLTKKDAEEIYRRDYWKKVRGDELPEPLGLVLFDWAVHSGTVTAILSLQRILGVKIDGKFGSETKQSAVSAHLPQLVEELLEERLGSMILIAIGDPRQLKYLRGGWKNRIVQLSLTAGKAL